MITAIIVKIKKTNVFLIIVLLILFHPISSIATAPAVTGNYYLDNCEELKINSMIRSLKIVEQLIPLVSPEDENYIRKEYEISMKLEADQRFNTLTEYQPYYAWQFHDSCDKLLKCLQNIKNLPKNTSISKKLLAFSEVPALFIETYSAWVDYVRYRGLLDFRSGYSELSHAYYSQGGYLSCLARNSESDKVVNFRN